MSADDQRTIALARAQVVRLDLAHVRRGVASGELSIGEALWDERAQPMAIGALLAQCQDPRRPRRWGDARAERYLGTHFIHPHRRVRDLTERQRRAIADELDPTIREEAA